MSLKMNDLSKKCKNISDAATGDTEGLFFFPNTIALLVNTATLISTNTRPR